MISRTDGSAAARLTAWGLGLLAVVVVGIGSFLAVQSWQFNSRISSLEASRASESQRLVRMDLSLTSALERLSALESSTSGIQAGQTRIELKLDRLYDMHVSNEKKGSAGSMAP